MQRALAIFYSLLLHAVLLGTLMASIGIAYEPRQPAVMKIEAMVVDEARIAAELEKIDAAEIAKATRQREAQEQLEQTRRERKVEQQRLAKLETERKQKEEQERQRQQELAKQREREEQERKQKAEAERERLEEQRLAKLKAEQEAVEQARRRAEAEAQLKAELEREQAELARQNSAAMNQYVAAIQQKVIRNWNRPPSARVGIKCEVRVTQVAGGEVTNVQVGRCNGDAAVVRSIENAVLKASPLPEPADPALFQRSLIFNFEPED